MHIAVCIKDIPNPEAPAALYSIDNETLRVVPVAGLSNVTSPFDEQALELALRLKDRHADTRVTAISLGPRSSVQAIKRALAMGADDGLHIQDLSGQAESSVIAAHALTLALRDLGSIDLVLTGRQAADWDVGVVGCGMAELLAWPVVCDARRIECDGRAIEVDRALDNGFETVRSSLPCVVTAANEVGPARKASLRETMRSAKKPIVARQLADISPLGSVPSFLVSGQKRIRLSPKTTSVDCHYLSEDVQVAATQLLGILRDDGVVPR